MSSSSRPPRSPLQRIRTIIMLCGIVVLITFMIVDHFSDPVRVLTLAKQEMIRDFRAETVEAYAEALVNNGEYLDSLQWFILLVSRDERSKRQVERLAEVFREWYDSQDAAVDTASRLQIAGTAALELRKYPVIAERYRQWVDTLDRLAAEHVREALAANRPVLAFERYDAIRQTHPDLPGLTAIWAELDEAVTFRLQDLINESVRGERWSDGSRYLEILRRVDPADPSIGLHSVTVYEALLRDRMVANDVEGQRHAATRLLEIDPEHPEAKAVLESLPDPSHPASEQPAG